MDITHFGREWLQVRTCSDSSCKAMCTRPSVIVNGTLRPELHRKAEFQYGSVVVVAHSLGAVVARQALLDLDEDRNPKWLNKISLVLFAPAHMGADVVPLGTEFLKESFHLAA